MGYGLSHGESLGVHVAHREFVPVTFARNLESAERLQSMLEQQNVPALVDDLSAAEDVFAALGRGVPVLVPEHMHERASGIVAEAEDGVAPLDGDEDDSEDDLFDDEDDDDLDDDFDDLDDLDDDYEDDDDDDDFKPEEDVDSE